MKFTATMMTALNFSDQGCPCLIREVLAAGVYPLAVRCLVRYPLPIISEIGSSLLRLLFVGLQLAETL